MAQLRAEITQGRGKLLMVSNYCRTFFPGRFARLPASSLSCGGLKRTTVSQDSPGEASGLVVECVSNSTCAYSFPGWFVCLQNPRRREERQGLRTFCFCVGVK